MNVRHENVDLVKSKMLILPGIACSEAFTIEKNTLQGLDIKRPVKLMHGHTYEFLEREHLRTQWY